VGPGHTTAAFGLAIDEQNPSGQACALWVTLENVAIAGSLPGNVATDPHEDASSQATLFGSTHPDYAASVLQRESLWAGDGACQQTIAAVDLTITHSATRGLLLTSAYTDWVVDGGLVVTYCGYEGILADHLDGGTLIICDSSGANPNLIASNLAGGVVNSGAGGVGSVALNNCAIWGNCSTQGAGVKSLQATTTIRNCLLADNMAAGEGGAVRASGGTLTIANCTVVNNSAGSGAGGIHASSATVNVANSIVWGNGGDELAGDATVAYCDVQGGQIGTGNIDRDPAFVAPAAADYHLRRSSPCINEGDPDVAASPGETDLDGQPRIQGGFVDIGADETPWWDGDADQDGDVDAADFAVLAECLAGPGNVPTPPPPMTVEDCLAVFDFDEDGDVDLCDFAGFRLR
jgi:hypothetical protein